MSASPNRERCLRNKLQTFWAGYSYAEDNWLLNVFLLLVFLKVPTYARSHSLLIYCCVVAAKMTPAQAHTSFLFWWEPLKKERLFEGVIQEGRWFDICKENYNVRLTLFLLNLSASELKNKNFPSVKWNSPNPTLDLDLDYPPYQRNLGKKQQSRGSRPFFSAFRIQLIWTLLLQTRFY